MCYAHLLNNYFLCSMLHLVRWRARQAHSKYGLFVSLILFRLKVIFQLFISLCFKVKRTNVFFIHMQ
jgi:hypothetical protein